MVCFIELCSLSVCFCGSFYWFLLLLHLFFSSQKLNDAISSFLKLMRFLLWSNIWSMMKIVYYCHFWRIAVLGIGHVGSSFSVVPCMLFPFSMLNRSTYFCPACKFSYSITAVGFLTCAWMRLGAFLMLILEF